MLEEAAELYRHRFQPSVYLDKPHFMMAINVFAGADDAAGTYLRSSMQQAFANLRTGRPGPLPRPRHDLAGVIPAALQPALDQALACTATGGPATVRAQIGRLIETFRPDEVIVTGQIHDHGARLNSFRIAAEALQALGATREAAE
jgi:alkanesulfonate monooxygenase SsuD/methylene tetrahydromethanopterin reductase-like flavin-dependent oxidoreductase (luciferase family)